MANTFPTPNMTLALPVVGPNGDPGPDWAYNLNNNFSILDGHSHSVGSGVQITPSGLNINADLTFGSNNAINLRSVRFFPQVSPLAGVSPDLGCLYESGVDLYYNDGNGNQVRITQSGGVAGSPGSISGLVAPASASYVVGTTTFVWQSAALTSANMDFGAATFRNITASSFGITLQPPVALGADYTLVFPAALPASIKFLTVDNAGNIGDVYDVDGSTIVVASNIIKVPTGGITNTQVADNTLGIIKLQSDLRTPSTYTGAGTYMYTVPADVNYIRVIGCGGGGGGGGAQNGVSGGGGGGGSPIFEGVLDVVAGETLTIVVGAGGTGGVNGASGTNGGNGGNTTITGSSSGLILTIVGATGGLAGSGGGTGGLGPSGYPHYGWDGAYTASASTSGGADYKGLTGNMPDLIAKSGKGGTKNGGGGGGGGGSIGAGGGEVVSPGPGGGAPWAGGIGAGGGGMDFGFNGAGGTGGDGQVTIYPL